MKSYFKIHKWQFISYIIVSIIYAVILAGTGFVYSLVTNAALGNDFNKFIGISFFSAGFLLLDSYFDFVPRYVRAKLINHILDSLRCDLVAHYFDENLQTIMKENPANRTNKLVHSLEVLENSYLKPLLSSIISVFVFIFSLAGAFYFQGTLTLIMLALCFLPFLAPVINQRILSDKKQEAQEKKNIYLSKFEDFSRNVATVRLMTASKIFTNILKKRSGEVATSAVEFEKGQAKTYAISYGLSNIIYSGTWIIGGVFVFRNLLTIPELIAMTTLMGTVAGPIQTVSGLATEFMSSKKVVNELLTLVNKENKVTDKNLIPFKAKIENLALQNISYKMNEQLLFEHLSFTFESGRKYAIIGESGVGKSTLLQLIMGIISSDTGVVILNNKKLSDFNKSTYYQHFTYVPQKTAIFTGTIAQNVSMFKEINENKIIDSLNKAGLKDWLERQEDGIYTILSTNNPLSGGEERRLDIARSLYRESEMIILDEPTSGLDQKNEQVISSVINSLTNKLVIVVTHSNNQAFLGAFDQILALENKQLRVIGENEKNE